MVLRKKEYLFTLMEGKGRRRKKREGKGREGK
jgi:hypothetical protein